MWLSVFSIVLIFFILNELGNPTPLVGPAELVIKFTEKCKLYLPTMIDAELRLYSRRGKLILQSNATFPFAFSDDIGYDINVAVKRNGGWKPNFMKFQGTGVCSFLKAGDPNLFKEFAKDVKAPEPPKCPLPPGQVHLDYSGADPTSALKKYGLEILPYGEFRISANVTHKRDVVFCVRTLADLIPKKGRGG